MPPIELMDGTIVIGSGVLFVPFGNGMGKDFDPEPWR
jgi:hypothetical protein